MGIFVRSVLRESYDLGIGNTRTISGAGPNGIHEYSECLFSLYFPSQTRLCYIRKTTNGRFQLPNRPHRPNSPTKLDQLQYTPFFPDRYSTVHEPPHDHSRLLHDFNPTIIPISTQSSRSQYDLFSTSSTSTQSRLDQVDLVVQGPWCIGRIEVELVGFWSVICFIPTKLDLNMIVKKKKKKKNNVSRSTRPLLNQNRITSRWLLGRLASWSLLEFFRHVQNIRVGNRSDAEQGRPSR